MYKSNNPKGFVIITDYHYLICLFIRTQSLFFILFNIFIRHWSHLSIFKSIRPWFIRSLRFYLILFVIYAFTCVFQPLQYFIIPFVILFFFLIYEVRLFMRFSVVLRYKEEERLSKINKFYSLFFNVFLRNINISTVFEFIILNHLSYKKLKNDQYYCCWKIISKRSILNAFIVEGTTMLQQTLSMTLQFPPLYIICY